MHEQRKSKYSIPRNEPHHFSHNISYEYVSPSKKILTSSGKKLGGVISRLTRQTESSGRKNRNTSDESFAKPTYTYTNIAYKPYSAMKKTNKKS